MTRTTILSLLDSPNIRLISTRKRVKLSIYFLIVALSRLLRPSIYRLRYGADYL